MSVSRFRRLRAPAMGLAMLAAVATGTSLAYAQETADIPRSHMALAQQAIELSRASAGFDDILPLVAEQVKSLFIRSNPSLTKEIEEVTDTVAFEFARKRADLDITIQGVWARRFSEAELTEIIAFYKSPVGAKLADLSPEMLALSVGAAKQWSDMLSTTLVTRVREEMQKRGHQL
jgi:hypothetical protein